MNGWVTGLAKLACALLVLLLIPVQAVIIPLAASETMANFPGYHPLAIAGIVWAIVAVACIQSVLVLLWVLLSMVGRGRIFVPTALGVLTAMAWVAAVFTGLMALAFAALTVTSALPGLVAIGLIAGALIGVMAFLVFIVIRGLLSTATSYAAELAEVI
ncbi:DUF2975 domain-containing protein [Microbacterium immunditiarum]|uniref:DUF2975 domain-containing protein n=1 Tax=Microbacterium immunditiarum TaxID=337480 RepID=A0A7Y9KLS7_9MICO|nr:DUF2975 domain-containing protein [Microbacterium immunditiarum]NYE20588.1 hypothetical protein [Microbacterium immunditiarum]